MLRDAAQRLSSPAFEAMPVFAAAKMGSGSNVRRNDLLCFIFCDALEAEICEFLHPLGWSNVLLSSFLK